MCNCRGTGNCTTCANWSKVESPTRVQWGECSYWTSNPSMVKITQGNFKTVGPSVQTTSKTRCGHYVAA